MRDVPVHVVGIEAAAAVTPLTATTDLCLDCGHTHECWCSGERDADVEATLCCDCDKEGRTDHMIHVKRVHVSAGGTE
jgi:hypothetical protein